MKALTVCQPYAELLCLPETDPRYKRVENRTWFTTHRGPMLIHAGKSKQYLEPGDLNDFPGMRFGVIVGWCNLYACVPISELGQYIKIAPAMAWLRTHQHVEGPWLWITTENVRLPEPIVCGGALGLWEYPDEKLRAYARGKDYPWTRCLSSVPAERSPAAGAVRDHA